MKDYQHFNLLSKNKKKKLKMQYIRTPEVIWKDLEKEFNFTVDACASDKNHLCKKYWTKENSALEQNWDGEIVYCHPMYDIHIPKFVKKAYESNCLTVFLLPASTNAHYFHKYFWKKENVEIRFIKKAPGQLGYKFNTDDNEEPKTGYLRPLMIIIMDRRKNA